MTTATATENKGNLAIWVGERFANGSLLIKVFPAHKGYKKLSRRGYDDIHFTVEVAIVNGFSGRMIPIKNGKITTVQIWNGNGFLNKKFDKFAGRIVAGAIQKYSTN